ncbi:MAG: hypothetical protein WDN75_07560 [Bacteroidota bacterium]
MEKTGYIEIKIKGSKGNLELTPDNYDIREIISMLENAENLLFPSEKKDRPTISYKIEEGSVKHIFKTSIQYIIGFNAILGQINESKNIDFLDRPTAKAIEEFQETAVKKDYIFTISTSTQNSNQVRIDRSTNFFRSEAIWADAEFYFYGRVTNAGGKDKANIHILTDELGTLRIDTPITFLEDYEDNLLYKTFGVRAIGKQHSETGEIDKTNLRFIELVDYETKYDEQYLKSLRAKAKKNWLGAIDGNKWLKNFRGGYE